MSKFQTRLILAILFLLPIYLVKIKFGFISLNLLEMLIGIAFFLWIFNQNTKYNAQNTKYFLPALLIFIGLLLSVMASGNYYTGLGAIKGWFVFPIVFGAIFFDQLKKDESLLRSSLAVLFFSGAAVSTAGLVYKLLGALTYDGRLKIFWDSPNQLAMFLAPPFLIGGYFALHEKSRLKKIFFLLGMILICLNLYYTFSYGAYAGLAVGLSAALWFERKRIWKIKYLFAVFLLVFLFFGLASFHKFDSWKKSGERSSLASRVIIWNASAKMIGDNPLVGIGPGNFQKKYLDYQQYFPPYLEWSVPQPHSLFLAFWLESGLLGLIGFLLLLVQFFRDNKKAISGNRGIGVLFLAIMVYFFIHGVVDTTYWRNDLAVVFWMIIAANIYVGRFDQREL